LESELNYSRSEAKEAHEKLAVMAYKAEDLKSAQDEAKKANEAAAELRGQLLEKNEMIASYLKASKSLR
jgi:hypothetical protein